MRTDAPFLLVATGALLGILAGQSLPRATSPATTQAAHLEKLLAGGQLEQTSASFVALLRKTDASGAAVDWNLVQRNFHACLVDEASKLLQSERPHLQGRITSEAEFQLSNRFAHACAPLAYSLLRQGKPTADSLIR
jgi:hypothetical protein